MRASEMRNCPTSMPKNSRFEAVADVGAGIAPLQHQERQGADDEGERERDLGEPRQLVAARRVEAEARLEHLADRIAPLLGIARHRADGEIEQAAHDDDDAGHHHLLGQEACERHVAEQRQPQDAERDQPQRQLEPARGVSRDGLGGAARIRRGGFGCGGRICGLRREGRQQQADEQCGEGRARHERLHDGERQRHEEHAGGLGQRGVDGVDGGDGAEQHGDAPRRPIGKPDEAPLRRARREHGEDQRGDGRVQHDGLQDGRRGGRPWREEQVQGVESAIEERGGGDGRQCAQRGDPGHRPGALEE